MVCNKCGQRNDSGDKFCGCCGGLLCQPKASKKSNEKDNTKGIKIALVVIASLLGIVVIGILISPFWSRQQEPKNQFVLESDKELCVLSEKQMDSLIADTLNDFYESETNSVNKALYNKITYRIEGKTDTGYMVLFQTPDLYTEIYNMDADVADEYFDDYIISRINDNDCSFYQESINMQAKTYGKNSVELYISNEFENILTGNLLNNYEKLYEDNF